MLEDNIYKIWNAEVVDEAEFEEIKGFNEPGTILISNSKKGLFVSTASGVVSFTEIQAPNSKRMNILDFLRGKPIPEGKIFN